MDSLDDFLKTLQVDLESNDEDQSVTGIAENLESKKRRETFTDSMLRDDVVAPNIVHFTSAAKVQSQNRKLIVIAVILLLSISGLFRFSKSLVPFFMEATSTVEEKQAVGNR